jgi:tetratricopeptide (TPR) repeat protein
VAPAPAPAPSKPAPNPVKAAPSPPPAAAAGDSEALLEEIDQAIAQGDLDRAVSLLAKCRGSGCLRRQKQIGYRYQGLGSTDKAIDAWKRAYRMTRDPREQESIRRIVRDLGGSVD